MIATIEKGLIALLICLPTALPAVTAVSASADFKRPTIPSEWLTIKPKKRNPACALSADSVLQKIRERQGIILVDVREKSAFEKFSIPGSINIPLFAIKTKAFLRSTTLVLVNEGYNYSQLERECGRLREAGFSVWLLDGGLYYWKQKGGPLKGDAFSQKALNRIPPRIFFAEKDYEDWLIIDVSASENPQARSLIPNSISIPYVNREEKFISVFEKSLDKQRVNPSRRLLIFNEQGKQYDKIEKVLRKTRWNKPFFLRGGIEAYREFLEKQAVIRQAKDHSIKKVIRCTNCP